MFSNMQKLNGQIQIFKPVVLEVLEQLRIERRSQDVCKHQLNGLDPSRLSELRKGKRELSYYYLALFVRGGLITVKQLMGGKTLDDFSPEQQEIIRSLDLEPRLAAKVHLALSRGIDIESILDTLLHQPTEK